MRERERESQAAGGGVLPYCDGGRRDGWRVGNSHLNSVKEERSMAGETEKGEQNRDGFLEIRLKSIQNVNLATSRREKSS